MIDGMNILVPYDGSVHADKALKEAIILAEKFYSHVYLLYCSWDEGEQKDMTLLKTREELLKESGIKYILTCESYEFIWQQIVEVARREMVGLIVMGTRGMGTARSVVMGSVSRKVIENAPCPVLVVK